MRCGEDFERTVSTLIELTDSENNNALNKDTSVLNELPPGPELLGYELENKPRPCFQKNWEVFSSILQLKNGSQIQIWIDRFSLFYTEQNFRTSMNFENYFKIINYENLSVEPENFQKTVLPSYSMLIFRILNNKKRTKPGTFLWSKTERLILIWLVLKKAESDDIQAEKSLQNLHIGNDEFWTFISRIHFDSNKFYLKYNWVYSLRAKRQAAVWSIEEDLIIKSLIREDVDKNKCRWNSHAMELFIRSEGKYFRLGKQIRERWNNHLNPSLHSSKVKWSDDEDIRVMELYLRFGSRWAMIANYLGSRNEHSVKNRIKKILSSGAFSFRLKELNLHQSSDIKTESNQNDIDINLRGFLINQNFEMLNTSKYLFLKPFFLFINEKAAFELGSVYCSCAVTYHSNLQEEIKTCSCSQLMQSYIRDYFQFQNYSMN